MFPFCVLCLHSIQQCMWWRLCPTKSPHPNRSPTLVVSWTSWTRSRRRPLTVWPAAVPPPSSREGPSLCSPPTQAPSVDRTRSRASGTAAAGAHAVPAVAARQTRVCRESPRRRLLGAGLGRRRRTPLPAAVTTAVLPLPHRLCTLDAATTPFSLGRFYPAHPFIPRRPPLSPPLTPPCRPLPWRPPRPRRPRSRGCAPRRTTSRALTVAKSRRRGRRPALASLSASTARATTAASARTSPLCGRW